MESKTNNETAETTKFKSRNIFHTIVENKYFKFYFFLTVIMSTIVLAIQSPLSQSYEKTYQIQILEWIIAISFLTEFILKILALTLSGYLRDGMNRLDGLVNCECITFVIQMIYYQYHSKNIFPEVIRYIKVARILRIIRYTDMLRVIHSQELILSSLKKSAFEILLIINIIMMILVVFSFILRGVFGDNTRNFCVPNDLTAYEEFDYGAAGFDPFTSNLRYCGGNYECKEPEFVCTHITDKMKDDFNLTAIDVGLSSDHDSFFVTFSFASMKEWSELYWIMVDSTGKFQAAIYLFSVFVMVTLMLVNLFPAVMLMKLKVNIDAFQWMKLLEMFELTYGKKKKVTQFDLVLFKFNRSLEDAKDITSNPFNGTVEDDEDDDTPEVQKAVDHNALPLVPNCVNGCAIFRDTIIPEGSLWNKLMLLIVILDISLISVQAKNPDYTVTKIANVFNVLFNVIFISELGIKLFTFGPYLYFSNTFHWLDFSIVFMTILDLALASSPVLQFAALLRLVRLFRLARLARLAKLASLVTQSSKSLSDTVLGQLDLVNIISDVVKPIFNILLQFLSLFVFVTMIGYYLFSADQSENVTGIVYNEYMDRISFDSFTQSVFTIYGCFTLDSWYAIMLQTQRIHGEFAYFFFVFWMVICGWLFRSLIRSTVAIIMEHYALKLFIGAAHGNEYGLNRVLQLKQKMILTYYFKVLKRNTIGDEIQKSKTRNTTIAKDYNQIAKKALSTKLWDNISEMKLFQMRYPLFIFQPNWTIVIRVKYFLKHTPFHTFVHLWSGIVTLWSFLVAFEKLPPVSQNPNNMLILSAFLALSLFESFLLWMTQSFYICLQSNIHKLDCILNILLIIILASVEPDRLFLLQAFRVLKVFSCVLQFIQKNILKDEYEFESVIVQSFYNAKYSLVSMVILTIYAISIFSVVALQLWLASTSYCDDERFPAAASRYEISELFPYGCSNVTNATFEADGNHTAVSWVNYDSKFDNIGNSIQAVYRVYMLNDWRDVLNIGTDAVGIDVNRKINNNNGLFFFFVIITLFSYITTTFFVGVVYYHYLITLNIRDKISLISIRGVLWAEYEKHLRYVNLESQLKQFDGNSNILHKMLYFSISNVMNKFFWILALGVPLNILIFGSKYDKLFDHFIPINLFISICYIIDYVIRSTLVYLKDINQKYAVADFCIVCYECYVFYLMVYISYKNDDLSGHQNILKISALLRFIRLLFAFPSINKYYYVIARSLGEFIPMLLFGSTTLALYAILGMVLFRRQDGSSWADEHYHFNSLYYAVVNLLSFATSNDYFLFVKMTRSSNPAISTVLKIYFYIFNLGTIIYLQSFSLILFHQYKNYAGDACGLSVPEINDFKKTWVKLFDYKKEISYMELKVFMKQLKHPLGYATRKGVILCALDFKRFMRRLLLSMPRRFSNSIFDSILRDSRKNENMYFEETNKFPKLPESLDMFDRKATFTFGQILIAVHKCAFFDVQLSDEVKVRELRVKHKDMLCKMRQSISYKQVEMDKTIYADERGLKYVVATQRVSSDMYRDEFYNYFLHEINGIQHKIHSSGYFGIFAFSVEKYRICLETELRRAKLTLEFENRYFKANSSRITIESVRRQRNASLHMYRVDNLLCRLNQLAQEYQQESWDIESIQEISSISNSEEVHCICVDHNSNIYCGSGNGTIKLYQSVDDIYIVRGGVKSLNPRFHYVLKQSLLVGKSPVLAMQLTKSGILIAGTGTEIVLVASSTHFKTKQSQLAVSTRNSGHTGIINCVHLSGYMYYSGCDGGKIIMWTLKSNEPLVRICHTSSPVLCISLLMRTTHELILNDYARNILVCGTKSGKIVVLPLTRFHDGDEEFCGEAWNNPLLIPGYKDANVSSVACAWGKVYSGSSYGEIKVWSVRESSIGHGSSQSVRFASVCSMVLMDKKAVHADIVSSIFLCGNHVFTSSHDLSIITWNSPHQLIRGHGFGFNQECHNGEVVHMAPITDLAGNQHVIVSSDSDGIIKIRGPTKNVFKQNSNDFTPYSPQDLVFSFLSYDFKDCILESKSDKQRKYEVELCVSNMSSKPSKLRCMFKKSNFLKLEVVPPLTNMIYEEGCSIKPFSCCYIRFVFIPYDVIKYQINVPFMVNNESIYVVTIKGEGIKPALRLENFETTFDFGSIEVNDEAFKYTSIHNERDCTIYVNCEDYFNVDAIAYDQEEEEEQIESEDKAAQSKEGGRRVSLIIKSASNVLEMNDSRKKNREKLRAKLSDMGITITPSSFTINPHSHVDISIKFSPKEVYPPFSVPLRVGFLGGTRMLATIIGRSKNKGKEGGCLQHISTSIDNFSLLSSAVILGTEVDSFQNVLQMLRCQGWNAKIGRMSIALYNFVDGTVVELIERSKTQIINNEEKTQKNNDIDRPGDNQKLKLSRESAVRARQEMLFEYVPSTALLSFCCVFNSTVELWYGDTMFHETEATGNEPCYIQITLLDIYKFLKRDFVGKIDILVVLKFRNQQTEHDHVSDAGKVARPSLMSTKKRFASNLACGGCVISMSLVQVIKGISIMEDGVVRDRLFVVGVQKTLSMLYIERDVSFDEENEWVIKTSVDKQEILVMKPLVADSHVNDMIGQSTLLLQYTQNGAKIPNGWIGFVEVTYGSAKYLTSPIVICASPLLDSYSEIVVEEYAQSLGHSVASTSDLKALSNNILHARHSCASQEIFSSNLPYKEYKADGLFRTIAVSYLSMKGFENTCTGILSLLNPMDMVERSKYLNLNSQFFFPREIASKDIRLSINLCSVKNCPPEIVNMWTDWDSKIIQAMSVSNKESTCKFSGKWKFLFALGHIKLVYKNDAEYKTPMELMLATRGMQLIARYSDDLNAKLFIIENDLLALKSETTSISSDNFHYYKFKLVSDANTILHEASFVWQKLSCVKRKISSSDYNVSHEIPLLITMSWRELCRNCVIDGLKRLVTRESEPTKVVAKGNGEDEENLIQMQIYCALFNHIYTNDRNTGLMSYMSSMGNRDIHDWSFVQHQSIKNLDLEQYLSNCALPKCREALTLQQARVIVFEIKSQSSSSDGHITFTGFSKWFRESEFSKNTEPASLNDGLVMTASLLENSFLSKRSEAIRIHSEQQFLLKSSSLSKTLLKIDRDVPNSDVVSMGYSYSTIHEMMGAVNSSNRLEDEYDPNHVADYDDLDLDDFDIEEDKYTPVEDTSKWSINAHSTPDFIPSVMSSSSAKSTKNVELRVKATTLAKQVNFADNKDDNWDTDKGHYNKVPTVENEEKVENMETTTSAFSKSTNASKTTMMEHLFQNRPPQEEYAPATEDSDNSDNEITFFSIE